MIHNNLIDTSQVGEIICSAYDCLENGLEDWLEDNRLQDSSDARKQFLKECGTFFVEFLDNVTFHIKCLAGTPSFRLERKQDLCLLFS